MSSDRVGRDARSEPAATRFADKFAETSVKGALTRAALAWVLITPAVAAAKIWWSGPAAAVVGVLSVTVYVVVALRFRRDRSQTSAT
jgi:ABC-type uncharacterized transport system permease subunit